MINIPPIALYLLLWGLFCVWFISPENHDFQFWEDFTTNFYFFCAGFSFMAWKQYSEITKFICYGLASVVFVDLGYYYYLYDNKVHSFLVLFLLFLSLYIYFFKKLL